MIIRGYKELDIRVIESMGNEVRSKRRLDMSKRRCEELGMR